MPPVSVVRGETKGVVYNTLSINQEKKESEEKNDIVDWKQKKKSCKVCDQVSIMGECMSLAWKSNLDGLEKKHLPTTW